MTASLSIDRVDQCCLLNSYWRSSLCI